MWTFEKQHCRALLGPTSAGPDLLLTVWLWPDAWLLPASVSRWVNMEGLARLAVPSFMRKLPTAPLPQESLRTFLPASLSLWAHSPLTLTLAGFQGLCSCSPPSPCISVFLVIKYPPWRLARALWFCLRKGSRGFPFEVPHFFFPFNFNSALQSGHDWWPL